MNKLKELWGNNKVLIVLGVILIACIIAIISVTISYFFGRNTSIYGSRLENVDKYPVTEEFKNEYIASLVEDKIIDSASVDIKVRTIYVTINFAADTELSVAESKANASLAKFSEALLSYYDVSFTLKSAGSDSDSGFVIQGAKNVAGSGLVWSNNTPVTDGE